MTRRQFAIFGNVPTPPYDWVHARAGKSSAWGVVIPVSERNDLHLLAQREAAGRWIWTLTIYRTIGGRYVRRIARGVAPTLSGAQSAAEASARVWLT